MSLALCVCGRERVSPEPSCALSDVVTSACGRLSRAPSEQPRPKSVLLAAALVSSEAAGAVCRAYEAVLGEGSASGTRPCWIWPAASSCEGRAHGPALWSADLACCSVVAASPVSRAAASRLPSASFSGLEGSQEVSAVLREGLPACVTCWCGWWGSRVARARLRGLPVCLAVGELRGAEAGRKGEICSPDKS